MNKTLLLTSMILLSWACKSPENKQDVQETIDMNKSYRFLLGTYTETPEQGISLVTFQPDQDGFEIITTASAPSNPSFVTVNNDQSLVFSVEETGGEDGGKVTSFRLSDDQLTKINTVSSEGNGTCYVNLDPTENFLVAGNYSAGTFAVIPVGEDGQLQPAVHAIQHEGSGANPNRQKQSHVHAAIFHPTDQKLFIADLGTDEVVVYDFDGSQEKPLTEQPSFRLKVAPGSGPRHMVFNSAGDRLYLVHEMTAEIGVYTYENGELEHLETQSLLQEGFEGSVGAAEVRITEDDQYLYVSNRGEANEIIGFTILEEGKLEPLQTVDSGGEAPRNFNITPDGEYLLVANQNSDNLLAFKRDPENGKLVKTDHSLSIYKPVYIKFLE